MNQADPPKLTVPGKVFADAFSAVLEYCKSQRPIPGYGLEASDSPTGGQILSLSPDQQYNVVPNTYYMVNGVRQLADSVIRGSLRDEEP